MKGIDLDGINAKLRRADQQIQMIDNEMDRLCECVRQSVAREVREEADEQVWVYRGPTPGVPVEWSVTIGEVLYNLRSSLDHLVWQLVLANGQKPGRHNEFPITIDNESWQKRKGELLKGVSQENQERIAHLQPYCGGIGLPFNVSMLTALNELGNIEKHRHLILAVIAATGFHGGILGIDPPELLDSSARAPFEGEGVLGKVEEGKTLLKFNNAHIEISSPSFEFGLSFAGEEQCWTIARSVPDLLSECHHAVKGSIEFVTYPHQSRTTQSAGIGNG